MIELLAHVLRQNHELRGQHTEAMTHLTNALNANQKLKREMWRLRRAAGEVCDAMERHIDYVAELTKDNPPPQLLVEIARTTGSTRTIMTVFATVRALSDAIGREPRTCQRADKEVPR